MDVLQCKKRRHFWYDIEKLYTSRIPLYKVQTLKLRVPKPDKYTYLTDITFEGARSVHWIFTNVLFLRRPKPRSTALTEHKKDPKTN